MENTVFINLVNGKAIAVKDGDVIVAIYSESNKEQHSLSCVVPNVVQCHQNHGIVLSVIDCISKSDYFVLNDDYGDVYSSKHIVSFTTN